MGARQAHALGEAQITPNIQTKNHAAGRNVVHQQQGLVAVIGHQQFVNFRHVVIKLRLHHYFFNCSNNAGHQPPALVFLRPPIISLRRSSFTDRFTRLYVWWSWPFSSSERWCERLMARKREAYCASLDSSSSWLMAICIMERSRWAATAKALGS